MSSSRSLTSIDVSEYDRIEAAMTESERGRWFLDEYVRRNRTNDTEILLDAIARLESVVTGDRESGQIGRVRGDLMDMAHAIARTKAEIVAISAPDHDTTRLGGASMALDAIVRSTERATSDILTAAEDVQEAAWTLRESGSDAGVCDTLDRRATEIYTACSFQDLTAQRTARIIHTLRYLEERLAAMMSIWGDALDTVPAAPGDAVPETSELCQSDVDRYIDMETTPVPEARAEPRFAPDLSGADDIVFIETDAFEQPSSDEPEAEAASLVPPGDTAETEDETAAFEAPEIHASEIHAPELQAVEVQALAFHDSEAPDAVAVEAVDEPAPADAFEESAEMPGPAVAETPVEKTDIAAAFADIDGLSDEEKRALFS